MLHEQTPNIRRKPVALKPSVGIRRYDRTHFEQEVLVQDGDGWEIPLDSVDISANGMFVKSSALFEIGETHTLHFYDVDGQPFRVEARVVRVSKQTTIADEDPGMGYEFQQVDERTYDALCECIATI